MHIVGLYRLNPRFGTEIPLTRARDLPGIFRTVQTTCGYGCKDSAIETFRINGGKINNDLAEFTKSFEQTNYVDKNNESLEIEIKGYRFDKETKALFIGVRTIINESPKLYEIQIAKVSEGKTQVFVKNKGNNEWEVNYSGEKYSLKTINSDLTNDTYLEFNDFKLNP